MILVDSSIWIDYFKSGAHRHLSQLLLDDLVVTNDIILSELIPSAKIRNERELIEGLYSLPKVDLEIDWEAIRLLQILNLQHGINKVGLADLVIVQSAIQNDHTLWSMDKHFYLMQEHVSLKLY